MIKPTTSPDGHAVLQRQLGLFGATLMGLGAMVGTGVFVGIGVAGGIAGPAVVLAIILAAGVAVCNALSSAQLAASHPVSGGTYEYGYQYLHPLLGFTAGWMFLLAKSASAATAALGFGGYLLHGLGWSSQGAVTFLGVVVAIVVTLLVLGGLKRSSLANIIIVGVTLVTLLVFIAFTAGTAVEEAGKNLAPLLPEGEGAMGAFLQACALMFVAYTGYGRIATMGEEVKEPQRTIPRAIMVVIGVSAVFYLAVGLAAIGSYGAESLGKATDAQAAPLETVVRSLGHPVAGTVVAVGAMTAMLGVLLNLILGLSRVALAMGRRGDLPVAFARIDRRGSTPTVAVIAVGALVTLLVLWGDVKMTWSFSAFTVLVYYAITNLAALRLTAAQRLYPRWVSVLGLASCLFLAFWVDLSVWLTGLLILGAGLIWHLSGRFRP